MDESDNIFDTNDDIFNTEDNEPEPEEEYNNEILNYYRGCSEEFLKNELENDPLLRAYAEKIDEHYGRGNTRMVLGIEYADESSAFDLAPEQGRQMPKYIICRTSAERDKNGLFQTILKSEYTVTDYNTGNIITLSEREKWYEHSGRSVEWQKVTENCPMYSLGMTVRFYGSDRAFKRAKRKSSYWRSQNVIIDTRWYTDFEENSWLLYVWHTQPLMAIPIEMLNE